MSEYDDRDSENEEGTLVRVYTFGNAMEAGFMEEVFQTEHLDYRLSTMQIDAFPLSVGEMGEVTIYVEEHDYDRARELIESAIKSKAISSDGTFDATDE